MQGLMELMLVLGPKLVLVSRSEHFCDACELMYLPWLHAEQRDGNESWETTVKNGSLLMLIDSLTGKAWY